MQKETTETTCKNNFFTLRNKRGDSRAPRGFAAKRTKSKFFGIIVWHKFDDNV